MLVREAVKNVLSPAARMFPVLAVAVLLGAGQTALVVHQADTLGSTLDELGLVGRNVVVLTPPTSDAVSTVSRTSCEGLTRHDQVRAAGLLGRSERTDIVELGSFVPVQPVSDTLLPLLTTHDAVVGAALRPEGAAALWSDGDAALRPDGDAALWSDGDASVVLVTASGQVLQAAVGPPTPAGVSTGSVVGVPLDPTTTSGDHCVVVLDPYLPVQESRQLVLSELQLVGEPLVASSPYSETVDVVALHLGRTERYVPAAVAVLAGFTTLALSRLRSSELAAYRLSGTSRRSLATMLLLEQVIVAGFFVTSATTATLALGTHLRDPTVPVLWAVVGGLAWVACAGAAASTAVLRQASDLAKDR